MELFYLITGAVIALVALIFCVRLLFIADEFGDQVVGLFTFYFSAIWFAIFCILVIQIIMKLR